MVETLTFIAGAIVVLMAGSLLIPTPRKEESRIQPQPAKSASNDSVQDRGLLFDAAFKVWALTNLRRSLAEEKLAADQSIGVVEFAANVRLTFDKSELDTRSAAPKRSICETIFADAIAAETACRWYLLGLHWKTAENETTTNEVALQLQARQTAMQWATHLDAYGFVAALGPTSIVCAIPIDLLTNPTPEDFAVDCLAQVYAKCKEHKEIDDSIKFNCVAKMICFVSAPSLAEDLEKLEDRLTACDAISTPEHYCNDQWNLVDDEAVASNRSSTMLEAATVVSSDQANELFSNRKNKPAAMAVRDEDSAPAKSVASRTTEVENNETVEVFARSKKATAAITSPVPSKPTKSIELDNAEAVIQDDIDDLFNTVKSGTVSEQAASGAESKKSEPNGALPEEVMTDDDISKLFEAARTVSA